MKDIIEMVGRGEEGRDEEGRGRKSGEGVGQKGIGESYRIEEMRWEGKMREGNIGEDERACDLPGKAYRQCTIQDSLEPISSTNKR